MKREERYEHYRAKIWYDLKRIRNVDEIAGVLMDHEEDFAWMMYLHPQARNSHTPLYKLRKNIDERYKEMEVQFEDRSWSLTDDNGSWKIPLRKCNYRKTVKRADRISYPAIRGRIRTTWGSKNHDYSNAEYSSALEDLGIITGTGGGGKAGIEYDFFIFILDFPYIQRHYTNEMHKCREFDFQEQQRVFLDKLGGKGGSVQSRRMRLPIASWPVRADVWAKADMTGVFE